MYKLLCHPGRTFTLDELKDHAEAMRKSMACRPPKVLSVTDIIQQRPVTDPFELKYLCGLPQFYRIPDNVLFKLVRVATGCEVRDRWVAVRTILVKRIPIPVPKPLRAVLHG